MNFIKGDEGEDMWAKHLTSLGRTVEYSSNGKPVYWDLVDDQGKKYEVKLDEKAYWWAKKLNRPPNIYVEYWSTKRNERCGIYLLEAEYFIYIVRLMDKTHEAYCFDTDVLLKHLESSDYTTRGNKRFGDDNAKGWTPPIHELVENKSSGFLKCVKM